MFVQIIKRLFCKHEFKTLTNLYGDAINLFNGNRSIKQCVYCGKIKFDGRIDPNCKRINKF